MENPSEFNLNFDLALTSPHELLCALRGDSSQHEHGDVETVTLPSLVLANARGQDFVGAGLRNIAEVSVQGSVGHFAFCSFGDGQASIDGNAGDFFGHSIASGMLVVRGHAKHAVGALGVGGLIAVYGSAEDRAAVGLQGADVVVRGSVASYAGMGMQSGTLVIGGNAGKLLGHGMSGGTIYLRGDAESISPDAEEQRLREPGPIKDRDADAQIEHQVLPAKSFGVFRASREDS